MKKSLPVLLIVMVCFFQSAQAQLLRFYYYPKSNVYYNVSSKEYIYNHDGAWTPVTDLPEELDVSGSQRIVMYSMKPDVWLMNDEHVEYYHNVTAAKAKKSRLFSFRKEEEGDEKK